MHYINYASGATRWVTQIDIKVLASQFYTNSVVSVIDTEKKRMLIRSKEGIAWMPIPELEQPTDEEIEKFKEIS